MKQLTQNLKTGKMEVSEVPIPADSARRVLVRNHYSLISVGTELSKVSTARKGYLGKAKERPEQAKQVLDTIQKEGIASAFKKVMNKLDVLAPLGYSASGEVIKAGSGISKFKVGDRVACAGAEMANHAEVISVPENLVVKVPNEVTSSEASFTTVASIAMHGVRQSGLRLGENCVVIGLGLIGQLTVQMLKASGIKVIGIDINKGSLELAKKSGADLVFERFKDQEERAIMNGTSGYGTDAVIITAATNSLDPIELAGKLCRKRGKVIIVGDVPTGFSRNQYYKKELELRMATSCGPGRYDPKYEEKGLDYPIAYVRWTENRNMKAFLDLVAHRKVNLDILTTHLFLFEEAPKAYQMVVDRSEPFVGILLKYDIEKKISNDVVLTREPSFSKSSKLKISFIGAGSFAQNHLLPSIKNAEFISVSTTKGNTSKNIAIKWKFHRGTTDNDSVVNEQDSNTLFIASCHHNHGELVLKGLKSKKHIFVEKPLCMSKGELIKIQEEYLSVNKNEIATHLMVGYNRRFAPYTQYIKDKLLSGFPISMNFRINAGEIPYDHWIQDKEIGGGRIIGEVCHFLDLSMFFAGSKPKSLYAVELPDPQNLMDTLNISIQFENGSIATISYYANGSKELKKEYIEVFSNGVSFVIDDFKNLAIYSNKTKRKKMFNQDKGHKKEIELFLDSIRKGTQSPIPFDELYYSSLMSFGVIESIIQQKVVKY